MRIFLARLPIAASALAAGAVLAACGGESATDSPAPQTIEERGRTAFAQCAVCHSVKDPEAPGYAPLIGPSLFGVFGAKAGRVSGYDYSRAMRAADLTWDEATLDAYLANPQSVVAGTRMSFAGEPDADRRAAIIAYLKTLR